MPRHAAPLPYLRRPVPVPRWALVLGAIVGVVLVGTTAVAAVTPTYNAQCVVTPKPNGGQVLDCDPVAVTTPSSTPSSSPSTTPSPSGSPTASPSPTLTTTPPSTTTPPPSTTAPPSSPPAALRDCLHQLAACGYPNAANTGVKPGSSLTVVNGSVTLSTAGMVYENRDVRGCITVNAPGVVIRNSRITCRNWWGILNQRTSGAPASVEDVEIDCGASNGTGIGYNLLTVRRAYVHDCENGFSIDRDVLVEDSYVPNTFNGNGAHGDAIQVAAPAANLVVRHSTLFAQYGTAAFNWTDQTTSILVERSFLGGGAYVVYCPRVTVAVGSFRVLNNRFADGMETYGLSDSCGGGDVTWSGNYRDSNLTAVLP